MLKRSTNLTAYMFLFPALVIFFVFFIWPNVEVFYLSLFRWAGISPTKVFVGLGNYLHLLTDTDFLFSLRNTLIIAFQSILIQIPVALSLAVILSKNLKGSGIFSTIIFLPMVISLSAVAIIWSWMFDPEIGTINMFLEFIRLENWQRAWLGEIETALLAVILVINWVYIGLYTIVFQSGLKSISPEIFEAAKVDGFNELQSTLLIRVPLLKELISVMIIMCISGSFKSFDLIWLMTGGGPVHSTEIVTTYLYRMAFRRMQAGYASTIGVAIFLMCLLLIMGQLRAMRIKARQQEESYG